MPPAGESVGAATATTNVTPPAFPPPKTADATEQMKQLMAGCQNPQPAARQAAEAKLESLRTSNLGALLRLLAQFMRAESGADPAAVALRQQAGLYIKNALTGKTGETQLRASASWLHIDAAVRAQIKPNLLATLASPEASARHTAALAIAQLGMIELTVATLVGAGAAGSPGELGAAAFAEASAALATDSPGLWPELLPALVLNATQAASNELKHASLDCLGFLCQNLQDAEYEEPTDEEEAQGRTGGRGLSQLQTDQVLTATVDGMGADHDERIRLAATMALFNSIELLEANFSVQAERDAILQALCEATQCRGAACGERVRVAAYMTINAVAEEYYDHLGGYMQVLFHLTFRAAREDGSEDVRKQAILFWSAIAEEEQLRVEAEAGWRAGGSVEEARPDAPAYYVKAALPHLVALLTGVMLQQEEGQEDDDWTLSQAGAVALMSVAQATGDDVLAHVMPFVHGNIGAADAAGAAGQGQPGAWRQREAAVLAFGCVLVPRRRSARPRPHGAGGQGESSEAVVAMVAQAVGTLMALATGDAHEMVRDSAAWCLTVVTEHHAGAVPQEQMGALVQCAARGLELEVSVAERMATCIYHLAHHFDASEEKTGPMSEAFGPLCARLFAASDRHAEAELQTSCHAVFEAINVLVESAAADQLPTCVQIFGAVLQRLEATFATLAVAGDAATVLAESDLPGQLISVIGTLASKLAANDVTKARDVQLVNASGGWDKAMALLLKGFEFENAVTHQEAFMSIGVIASSLKTNFEKYLPAVMPAICKGLQNRQAPKACMACVGMLSSIVMCVKPTVLTAPQPGGSDSYCDTVATLLLAALQDPTLDRIVLPPAISAFGDIAMCIGAPFEKYIAELGAMLASAAVTELGDEDEEEVEYKQAFWTAISQTYCGVLHGFCTNPAAVAVMAPTLHHMLQFVQMVATDEYVKDVMNKEVLGLLGDACKLMPAACKPFVAQMTPWLQPYLAEALQDEDAQENAQYAQVWLMKLA